MMKFFEKFKEIILLILSLVVGAGILSRKSRNKTLSETDSKIKDNNSKLENLKKQQNEVKAERQQSVDRVKAIQADIDKTKNKTFSADDKTAEAAAESIRKKIKVK